MHGRAMAVQLAALYASPRRVRPVPAAALLGCEIQGRAVRVTIERPGGERQRITIEDAADPRLEGLRPIDRRRVALMLGEAAQ